MNVITISRNKIKKQGGVVILPLKEYQKLYARAVPTYYLKGGASRGLDKLVKEGLKEYGEGKTESLENFLKREYPTLHEKYSKS